MKLKVDMPLSAAKIKDVTLYMLAPVIYLPLSSSTSLYLHLLKSTCVASVFADGGNGSCTS